MQKKTVKSLKLICKSMGLKKYSKLKKQELILFIQENEVEEVTTRVVKKVDILAQIADYQARIDNLNNFLKKYD